MSDLPAPFVLEAQRHLKWRAFDILERILLILCGVAITGFTVTVTCDIVTRTIGHPWLWLQEVTTTFFIYGAFLGTAVATRRNDHLYLAVLAEQFTGTADVFRNVQPRRRADRRDLHDLLRLPQFSRRFQRLRMPSMTPLSSYYAAIPICGVLVALFTVEQLINGWRNGFPEQRHAYESRGSELL